MVWEQRAYQQEAIAAALSAFVAKGVASVMLESPVGSGKTYMGLETIHRIQERLLLQTLFLLRMSICSKVQGMV